MIEKNIEVFADWIGIGGPVLMGNLYVSEARGKEIFAFEYNPEWLEKGYSSIIDPDLSFSKGRQYTYGKKDNFGIFLDSSPDRWGRVLMKRREAIKAREANRRPNKIFESDFMLGVYDGHRMGGLRFRLAGTERFLDDQDDMASPPWTKLRELEYASLQLEDDNAEKDENYNEWIKMLIAPGGSLGGARPKSGVIDEEGNLWIAKFPSTNDDKNIGKWEYLVNQMAKDVGINVSETNHRNFSGKYDTFITKRFDRTKKGERIHFASAMTMLGKTDGDGADEGVSYLDLAKFIICNGANPEKDLEELWRRIAFYVCVSNTDDHLRNHGFILAENGWGLSPAYDINPNEDSNGLSLNISQDDNSLNLDLVKQVAEDFRVNKTRADKIITKIQSVVRTWEDRAKKLELPQRELDLMQPAFKV